MSLGTNKSRLFLWIVCLASGCSSSLHQAALNGDVPEASRLLLAGADVNRANDRGYTPLHYAAINGHKALAELLLAKGAAVNAKRTIEGLTAMHYAALKNHPEVAQVLLRHEADVNARDDQGYTPLHLAVIGRSQAVVRLLVSNGAEVNAKERGFSYTPLHCAVYLGDKETVEVLLGHGAEVNAPDVNGWTPLHVAAGHKVLLAVPAVNTHASTDTGEERPQRYLPNHRNGRQIAQMLLDKGADINAQSKNGYTALYEAVLEGDEDLVTLFITRGAYVHIRETLLGATPLHYSTWHKNTGIAQRLMNASADGNVKDNQGRTPLHWAAEKGTSSEVKFLLARGVDAGVRDRAGLTALQIARQRGHKDVVTLLQKYRSH